MVNEENSILSETSKPVDLYNRLSTKLLMVTSNAFAMFLVVSRRMFIEHESRLD